MRNVECGRVRIMRGSFFGKGGFLATESQRAQRTHRGLGVYSGISGCLGMENLYSLSWW